MNRSIFLKILPPLWLLIFLAGAFALHYMVPSVRMFDVSNAVVGGALVFAGVALTVWSALLFKKAGTEINPTSVTNKALLERGPYAFTRNPMYLGNLIVLLGAAFFMGTLPFFLAPLAQFLLLNFTFIPFEEEKMRRQFGEQFNAYTQKVRRWV